MAASRPSLNASWRALRRRALVALFGLGTIGLVTAGPHGRLDGFEVCAGLGVQQPGKPGHAVGPLRAEMQPAAARPVLVGEKAVGIQVVGDPLAQLDDNTGVEFGRVLHQPALGFCHVGGRDAGGQYVDRSAYGADVILADRAHFYRGRQLWQLRLHRGTGQRAPRPDPGREFESANDLSGRDA